MLIAPAHTRPRCARSSQARPWIPMPIPPAPTWPLRFNVTADRGALCSRAGSQGTLVLRPTPLPPPPLPASRGRVSVIANLRYFLEGRPCTHGGSPPCGDTTVERRPASLDPYTRARMRAEGMRAASPSSALSASPMIEWRIAARVACWRSRRMPAGFDQTIERKWRRPTRPRQIEMLAPRDRGAPSLTGGVVYEGVHTRTPY